MLARAAVLVVPIMGALLAASGAAPAQRVHPAPDALAVTDHAVTASGVAAVRYWTPERMRHARTPPPPPLPGSPRAAAPPVPRHGGELTTGRFATGAVAAAPWVSHGAVRATTGKVFFSHDGSDFFCSAGTVRGANRDLVVTAGHCAQDVSGTWAQHWVYVPGYAHGRAPYGVFPARHLFTPTAWARRHDVDDDIAMVAVATSGGRHVADAAGSQSIAFGRPSDGAVVYGFGYPIGGRYDGEGLAYCTGPVHPDARRRTGDEGLRCDMAEGASGGPWLTRFDPRTGTGLVTSVNSFKYADDPDIMYGPYFGPAVRHLYDVAQHA